MKRLQNGHNIDIYGNVLSLRYVTFYGYATVSKMINTLNIFIAGVYDLYYSACFAY